LFSQSAFGNLAKMERKDKTGKTKKIIIKRIVVGPIETNCYLVADNRTRETVIIDPGGEPEKIFSAIKENGLKPRFILLTHEHPDHTGALEAVSEFLNIKLRKAKDGEEIKIGDSNIKIIATPGHSAESVCFIVSDPADGGAGNIFSGDTLFYRGIGRTDLEGGDFIQIQKSLKYLMKFPDNFKAWPGHGPETTIGEERELNPFL
jgi:glyoxylase-like metal-dependent hydrolase (beta-lactamase superfamily II)